MRAIYGTVAIDIKLQHIHCSPVWATKQLDDFMRASKMPSLNQVYPYRGDLQDYLVLQYLVLAYLSGESYIVHVDTVLQWSTL